MKVTNSILLRKLQCLEESIRFIGLEIETIKSVLSEGQDEEKPNTQSKTKGQSAEGEKDGDNGHHGRRSPAVLEEGMAVRITTNPYRGKTGVITDRRSKLPQPNGRTYWNIRLDVGNGSKRGPIIYKMEKNLTKCSTG
jgi:hypothetical protein